MNCLFVSLDFVLPPDRGLRVRTLSQLRLLASLPRVERVTFLSLSAEAISADALRALERELPKVKVLAPVRQPVLRMRDPRHAPRMLFARARFGYPYLVAKSENAAMHALVRRHLREQRYDVVYIGFLGMMGYVRDVRSLAPNARIVLEEHNVEWEIFERLADRKRPPRSWAWRAEARALRRYEIRALREVNSVIAISDADARAFKELAGIDAVVVPQVFEARAPRVESTKAPSLAYVGHLTWQPNAHGLDWFCESVWPLVRARVPDATLKIAGSGLPKRDGRLDVPAAWQKPGIEVVGFVSDLEDLYRSSVAMVAPILGGSGVRMKLIESMSAGMPTVTTTDGAAGLDVVDGRELLIADGAPEFADRIAEVLADANLRVRLRAAGYAFLERHHSAAAARPRLEAALGIRAIEADASLRAESPV